MEEQEHICLCCGSSFEPTCHISRQKYCCAACRIKHNNAKRYFGGQAELCPNCGENIEQSGEAGRWRRFCSDRCRKVYHYKKHQEKLKNKGRPAQICPNCGIEFTTEYAKGTARRFCSDGCRIEWWDAYHKSHPKDVVVDNICKWCGKRFSSVAVYSEMYCSTACSVAAQDEMSAHPKARRQLSYQNIDQWCEGVKDGTKKAGGYVKRERRVFCICGITSMYIGLDGLIGIITHKLLLNPFDGNIYVFCDIGGTMLKYLEWDGAGFTISKRRAQSGSYPWPPADAGKIIEISEKEFLYLRQKSIVPTGIKKVLKTQEKRR